MSTAIRQLRGAVLLFGQLALEEDIDPEQLRDVINELEYELEWLYEPVADRARLRAESEAKMQQVVQTMTSGVTRQPSR